MTKRHAQLRLADRLADMEVVFGSESILSKEHLALSQASQTIQSYGFSDALIACQTLRSDRIGAG
jgi:hypothetical protein